MTEPHVSPAPGPFVYLRLVTRWTDDHTPIYETFLLSNEQAEALARDLKCAANEPPCRICGEPKECKTCKGAHHFHAYEPEQPEQQREARTPFHGKPNEPIAYRADEVPKT